MMSDAEAASWLARHPRSTIGELAAASDSKPQAILRQLQRLERSGRANREILGGSPWLWSATADTPGGVRSAARNVNLDGSDSDVARAVRDAVAVVLAEGQATLLAYGGDLVAKVVPLGITVG
jgi:hypothetical protein